MRTVLAPSCPALDTADHGDEASATEVASLSCGGSQDLGVVATLDGAETDWFQFLGSEAFGCPEQLEATVTTDAAVQVCVFLACVEGGVIDSLLCQGGSVPSASPEAESGCCGADAAGVESYACLGGLGKDVRVWISVSTTEDTCADDGLSLSF